MKGLGWKRKLQLLTGYRQWYEVIKKAHNTWICTLRLWCGMWMETLEHNINYHAFTWHYLSGQRNGNVSLLPDHIMLIHLVLIPVVFWLSVMSFLRLLLLTITNNNKLAIHHRYVKLVTFYIPVNLHFLKKVRNLFL